MEPVKTFLIDTWVLLVKTAQVVAGVKLFQCSEVQTMFGSLPAAQILGAVLITDVAIYFYCLRKKNQ